MHGLYLAASLACAAPGTAEDEYELAASPSGKASVSLSKLPANFWEHWGDGRAEIDAYALVTPRYGELRTGRAVLVFVTEDFTDAQRVKSDGGHEDEYPVLKLNEMRDFQTGIYDYSVMTSSFVRIDGRGTPGVPVKVSMSMQDWCGHVWEQILPRGDALAFTGHSYFDGEADDQRSLPIPRGGVLLDALPIFVRGVTGPVVAPGESVELPVLPTLMSGRFAHEPVAWTTAVVRRAKEIRPIEVPAGRFDVFEVTTEVKGGAATTWQIESAWPHRIVRWSNSEGERAELIGSQRVPYWELNAPGNEAKLAELGLSAPAPLPRRP